jgi:hypothetical protein
VADVVATSPIPGAARRDVALWASCASGALTIDEYRRLLLEAGFQQVEIEPLRDFPPATFAAWDGEILSGFVRARKPARNAG